MKEKVSNIRFENNEIYNAKIAIKVTGGDVTVANNLFDSAKVGFWVEKNGRLTDAGSNSLRNITERRRNTEGGVFID